MTQKIWEMVAVVERYSMDNDVSLWNECIRFLESDSADAMLRDPISVIDAVNDGFLEAKEWLVSQGLQRADGTLAYSLRLIAYNILLRANRADNKPEILTGVWFEEVRNVLKNAYSKLPFRGKNTLSRLGDNVLIVGRFFENPRLQLAPNLVCCAAGLTWVHANIILLLNIFADSKESLSAAAEEDVQRIREYSKLVFFSVFCCIGMAVNIHTFFYDRQQKWDAGKRGDYLPAPEELEDKSLQNEASAP